MTGKKAGAGLGAPALRHFVARGPPATAKLFQQRRQQRIARLGLGMAGHALGDLQERLRNAVVGGVINDSARLL